MKTAWPADEFASIFSVMGYAPRVCGSCRNAASVGWVEPLRNPSFFLAGTVTDFIAALTVAGAQVAAKN